MCQPRQFCFVLLCTYFHEETNMEKSSSSNEAAQAVVPEQLAPDAQDADPNVSDGYQPDFDGNESDDDYQPDGDHWSPRPAR